MIDSHLALHAIKDEPALLPGLDAPTHLVQEAATRVGGDDDVWTHVQVVAAALDVLPQVKVLAGVGQETRQGPRLHTDSQRFLVSITVFCDEHVLPNI